LAFNKLKIRIKKNEGFSLKPYKDQLGYYTIGFGHLIRKNEDKYFKTKYKKKYLEQIFQLDFNKALNDYKKFLYKKNHKKNDKELLIEMLFQLGSRGVLKFRKMLFYLNKKQKYMVCLQMLDSLWYKQTPLRVKNLIKNYLKD
tara:strand:- start:402 stop:830 length:429 start_codon:yes stop_codon:yes gene_type:complete